MADNRKFIELLKAGFEPISDYDIEIANYMISLLPEGLNAINIINPNEDFRSTFKRTTSSFNMYGDNELKNRVIYERTNAKYFQAEVYHPYVFETRFLPDEDLKPLITIPQVVDHLSYIYLAHEFHHVLKDTNPEESKIKYRFSEVIPMFYELVRADSEVIEVVKKEIINRRIALLQFDLSALRNNFLEYEQKRDKGLKYFNSFYYSLALFRLYKENPKQVLTLVAKVLKQELSTLDMLYLLDLYDNGMDTVVKEEMDGLKLLLKNS